MAEGGRVENEVTFHNEAFDENDYDDSPLLRTDDMSSDRRPGDLLSNQRNEVLKLAVDAFYKELNQRPEYVDYKKFKLVKNKLYVRDQKGTWVKVEKDSSTHGSKYYKLTTLKAKASDIYTSLGIDRPTVTKKIRALEQTIPKQFDNIEMKDLADVANNVSFELQEVETSFTEENAQLTMRELIALDRNLQTFKGELVNNLAKLGVLDEHIAREKGKIAEADDDPRIDKKLIEKRLKDLYIERQARLEVLNVNRERLINQFQRIKDTLFRIMHEDSTLGEKLKTLFKEQGITIASILTALGFIISTMVLAITGGGGGSGSGGSKPSNGAKDWIKKQLNRIADLFKELANKALVALPGVIGSIVSWLLSTIGKAASWLANNLWALVLAGGGMVITFATKGQRSQ